MGNLNILGHQRMAAAIVLLVTGVAAASVVGTRLGGRRGDAPRRVDVQNQAGELLPRPANAPDGAAHELSSEPFPEPKLGAVYELSRDGQGPLDDSSPGAGPLDRLDRCIQDRFRTIGDNGMARIPTLHRKVRGSDYPWFKPETPEEIAAVSALRDVADDAGFYLGSRKLLGPKKGKDDRPGSYRAPITDPLRIARNEAARKLPEPWDLWEVGRRALAPSPAGETVRDRIGPWFVDARPIRASREACVSCHNRHAPPFEPSPDAEPAGPLRVGDALGVAIYVYRRGTD